jgi:hypothetical protein
MINTSQITAGIVVGLAVSSYMTTNIFNVTSSCYVSNQNIAAGFIYIVYGTTININNSLFNGVINGVVNASGFIVYDNLTLSAINNCTFNGTITGSKLVSGMICNFVDNGNNVMSIFNVTLNGTLN